MRHGRRCTRCGCRLWSSPRQRHKCGCSLVGGEGAHLVDNTSQTGAFVELQRSAARGHALAVECASVQMALFTVLTCDIFASPAAPTDWHIGCGSGVGYLPESNHLAAKMGFVDGLECQSRFLAVNARSAAGHRRADHSSRRPCLVDTQWADFTCEHVSMGSILDGQCVGCADYACADFSGRSGWRVCLVVREQDGAWGIASRPGERT